LITKFEGGPLDRGLKLGWLVSDFAVVYLGNGARLIFGNNSSLIESHITLGTVATIYRAFTYDYANIKLIN